MHPLKNNRSYNTCNRSVLRCRNNNVFRSDNDINQCSFRHIIHSGKFPAAETHLHMSCHNTFENVTLSDKIGYKRIFRFIVNVLWRTNLLDFSLRKHHNFIRHRKRFFLVVRYIDKCNAKLVVHIF